MGRKRTARQRLIQKIDRAFSRYIRWKNLDEDGRAECYTCRKSDKPINMHCGHFASRRHMSTRWDPDNARPQCVNCNIYHNGRQWEFGARLDTESVGLAADVIRRSKAKKAHTMDELRALFLRYDDTDGVSEP